MPYKLKMMRPMITFILLALLVDLSCCQNLNGLLSGGSDENCVYIFTIPRGDEGSCPSLTEAAGSLTEASSPVSLLAYYPLDCDSKDHSDNERHGANIGSALYSEDAKCGNSRFFNGASKIQVDAFNGFNWGQAFSVSVWIKRTGQANYQGVVNNGYYSTGSWEIRMGREDGGTMIGGGVVTSNSPRTWDYQITGRVLTLDEWHHVVMAYDGADGSLKYYIDGVERDGDESCCSGALLVKNTPLTIGQAGSGANTEYFYGFIDEVKLFAETLTADDVSKLYNTPCQ